MIKIIVLSSSMKIPRKVFKIKKTPNPKNKTPKEWLYNVNDFGQKNFLILNHNVSFNFRYFFENLSFKECLKNDISEYITHHKKGIKKIK